MKHNKIKAYWLLLPALLLVGSIALAPGQAYARYATTVTSVAVIDTPTKDIRSNCLVTDGEATRTVLLGQLAENETLSVPFWLLSASADASVKLEWAVADPAYGAYLNIAISQGNERLNDGEELLLPEDAAVELALQLSPTELAVTTPPENRQVDVTVTVAKTLRGTFRVILPGDGGEYSLALPTEEPTPVPETEPAEPEEPELTQEQKEALMTLKTLSSFHMGGQLPMRMVLADHITAVRVGMDSSGALAPLPDYAMLSLDGGKSYYMTYGAVIPRIATGNAQVAQLLLDLRYAQVAPEGSLTLAMQAYQEQALRVTRTAVTAPDQTQQWQSVPLYQTAPVSGEERSSAPANPILTFENKLEFSFPTQWEESQMDYTVECLTVTEDNTLTYVPVEPSDDGLQATYTKTADSHKLTLQLGQKFSRAGTYRLRITWNYEGIYYSDNHTTFLVNCLGRRDAAPSGQEVAHDE